VAGSCHYTAGRPGRHVDPGDGGQEGSRYESIEVSGGGMPGIAPMVSGGVSAAAEGTTAAAAMGCGLASIGAMITSESPSTDIPLLLAG
jgi:hypothetical protein